MSNDSNNLINNLINRAIERIRSGGFVLQNQMRVYSFYLDAAVVEKLRLMLMQRGLSLSKFINDILKDVVAALENSPENRQENQEGAKTPEGASGVKCFIISCERLAVSFALNKRTGRRYPICLKHLEDIKDHPDWSVENSGSDCCCQIGGIGV